MSGNKERSRRVDPGTIARGLRTGADLLEQRDVAGAVETVLEHVGPGHEHGQAPHKHSSPAPEAPRTPRPQPSSPAPTPVPARTPVVDPTTIDRDGYTSPTPFSPKPADVVVVCCSSEKFELQHQEFIKALGFNMPHIIQVPGGPASLYSLAAVAGFISKAMGTFVHKAVELVEVKEVVLIAHEECGAYKESGRVSILGQLTRRLLGKTMKEAQVEHLQKAGREMQGRLGRAVRVRTYYANLVDSAGVKKIRFEPISP